MVLIGFFELFFIFSGNVMNVNFFLRIFLRFVKFLKIGIFFERKIVWVVLFFIVMWLVLMVLIFLVMRKRVIFGESFLLLVRNRIILL